MKSVVAKLAIAAVVALLVGCALYWGFVRSAASESVGSRVEVDFTHAQDGPPPSKSDSGKGLVVSSPADPGSQMRVSGGLLTFAPTTDKATAAYLSTTNLEAPVVKIGCRWTFLPPVQRPAPAAQAGNGAVVLVISKGIQRATPQLVPPYAMHLVVTAINWNVSVKPANPTVQLEIIARGNFKDPLVSDGSTPHEISVRISGSRMTIELPDGTSRVVNDPRVSQWQGNFATFELYSNRGSTDTRGGFSKVWAEAGK